MILKRFATQHDLEQVFAIYMDKSVIPYLGYDPMPLQEFRSVYAELLAAQSFYVYEVSGKLAGFYEASRYPGRASHVAYIGTLAVSPEFQGQGIARSMMLQEIDYLRSTGVKRIEIIVESDNAVAIAFYKRLGFEIEGTLRKFYKRSNQSHYVDDYMMSMVSD